MSQNQLEWEKINGSINRITYKIMQSRTMEAKSAVVGKEPSSERYKVLKTTPLAIHNSLRMKKICDRKLFVEIPS